MANVQMNDERKFDDWCWALAIVASVAAKAIALNLYFTWIADRSIRE